MCAANTAEYISKKVNNPRYGVIPSGTLDIMIVRGPASPLAYENSTVAAPVPCAKSDSPRPTAATVRATPGSCVCVTKTQRYLFF